MNLVKGIIKRRNSKANMFLNGEWSYQNKELKG